MGYETEVVVVRTPNGPVRVNKSDYDADPKAYGTIDKPATEETAQTPAVAENVTTQNAAPQYFVQKEGRKFFVFNLTGQKAADEAGYKTEDDAREAMKALTD